MSPPLRPAAHTNGHRPHPAAVAGDRPPAPADESWPPDPLAGPRPGERAKGRVLVIDNQPLFRDGLTARLAAAPDLEVAGEGGDLTAGMSLLGSLAPDALVVDVAIKDGLTLIGHPGRAGLPTRVLVLSALDPVEHAVAALEAGAAGYVGKHEHPDVVLTAVRQVLSGRTCFPAGVLDQLVRAQDGPAPRGVGLLSPRERQVFELLGDGFTAKQIAARLGMSVHTVDTHRERIKRKLQLTSGTALYRQAVEWKLRRPPASSFGRTP